MTDPIFLDFETEAIGPRPHAYPPKPVGIAVLDRTGEYASMYYGWGHPTENNCSLFEVQDLLEGIWASGRSVCFHNSMFDLDVMSEFFNLRFPAAERVHDTLTLAFLHDCHAPSLALKELAKVWLGHPPAARDELNEWLIANIPELKRKPKQAGAFICMGPGGLVGQYAMEDVRMTAELFDYTEKVRSAQPDAYLREIKLQPVLLENSRLGVRVDRPLLTSMLTNAKEDIATCEVWLADYFDDPTINFNSGAQLVKAVVAKGCWKTKGGWPTSDKGTPLTDKETLSEILTDKSLIAVLRYRDLLEKLCGTYIEPWLLQSESSGRIYTEWNAVRGERGGTRTGRLSGKPTLQTMPVRYPMTELPEGLKVNGMPKVREAIIPDEGHVLISADFQAQELRCFAHFEDGALAEQYRNDPRADLHQFAADMMTKSSGHTVTRTYAKGISFAILYGAGPRKISEMLEIPYTLAKELMDAYQTSVAPGLAGMNDDMRSRYARQAPIKTLGGRLVKGEPPKVIMNRLRKFDYKLLNLLIQGSSADMCKAAMIMFDEIKPTGARLLMSVHDELVVTAPTEIAELAAERLTFAMCNALTMDVPLIADAVTGKNYAEVKG